MESESRTAARRLFEAAGWVPRDLQPDYGLDQHVEIFDGFVATGLFFFTQLKATDEPDLQRALGVAFSASSLNYFDAVDEPVLLLRFHAPSETFFGRWFHRVDNRSAEATTPTIRFSPHQVIDVESLAEIRNEVMLFRTLRNAIVRWPLGLRVSSTDPEMLADDVTVACTASAGAQRYVRYLAPGMAAAAAEAAVAIAGDQVVIHTGAQSVTLHGKPREQSIEDLAADIVFATGLCLAMAGHHDAGGRLMRQTASRSAAVADPAVIMRTAAALAQGRRTGDALDVGRALIGSGRPDQAQILASLAVLPVAGEMVREDRAAVGQFFDQLAAALSSIDPMAGARAHYSAANWHFNCGRYGTALTAYKRAAQLVPLPPTFAR